MQRGLCGDVPTELRCFVRVKVFTLEHPVDVSMTCSMDTIASALKAGVRVISVPRTEVAQVSENELKIERNVTLFFENCGIRCGIVDSVTRDLSGNARDAIAFDADERTLAESIRCKRHREEEVPREDGHKKVSSDSFFVDTPMGQKLVTVRWESFRVRPEGLLLPAREVIEGLCDLVEEDELRITAVATKFGANDARAYFSERMISVVLWRDAPYAISFAFGEFDHEFDGTGDDLEVRLNYKCGPPCGMVKHPVVYALMVCGMFPGFPRAKGKRNISLGRFESGGWANFRNLLRGINLMSKRSVF